jgi:hypothetical protein
VTALTIFGHSDTTWSCSVPVDRNELARAHNGIGHAQRALGHDHEARTHWTESFAPN